MTTATAGTHCAMASGMWIVRLAICSPCAFVVATLLLSHFTLPRARTDFFRAMTRGEM